MEFLSDVSYAISKNVAKKSKDTLVGWVAIIIMSVATFFNLITVLKELEAINGKTSL